MPRTPEDDTDQIEVDGLRIAYRRAGDGAPLVLPHGGPLDGREWRRQLEDLSNAFTVVAWDQPGCGRSQDPPERFRSPEYADCLAGFIEVVGLQRPHVVGLSFGAVLALELFRRHPRIPRSLVLASAYAGWAGSFPPDVVEQRLQTWLGLADLPPDEWARAWIPGLLTDEAPAELVDEVVAILSDVHPAGQRTVVHAFGEADLRDVLPRIDVPTLLLYGDGDVRSPVSVGEDLHGQIPWSKLMVIPGAAHLCDMEAPERFTTEVQRFLESVDR